MDEVKLSLVNIKEGAAVEMFDNQLNKVLSNIHDINTSLKPREITLKVRFVPSEDRTLITLGVSCTSKLAVQDEETTTADLLIDSRGRAFAKERIPAQLGLAFHAIPMQPQNGTAKD